METNIILIAFNKNGCADQTLMRQVFGSSSVAVFQGTQNDHDGSPQWRKFGGFRTSPLSVERDAARVRNTKRFSSTLLFDSCGFEPLS